MQRLLTPSKYLSLLLIIKKFNRSYAIISSNLSTSIDAFDLFTNDHNQRYKMRERNQPESGLRYLMEMNNSRTADVTNMTIEEIDKTLTDLLSKKKDTQIVKIVNECLDRRKFFSIDILKRLFRYYSISGRVDVVEVLQKYCSKVDYNLYLRNGEFMHYTAKAQCMKGNSEKGLSVLKQAYIKYRGLRNFYRVIFKELINDSVLNRSEASLVIFKKYVLEFSNEWEDHYPLICYWHLCWSSNWFSDQMLSDELLEASTALQNIIRDKATVFSINILREYNEDAVIRLLQSLLKYNLMEEYTKVLQILFNHKLRNEDLRGCTEILKNCDSLGITLPSDQQGKYIKMLIYKRYIDDKPGVKTRTTQTKNFKLKF